MDSLPTEIVQRVFHLLPPRDFYGTIPLVSQRFREDALGAIPGCPGNTIAIACEALITGAGYGLEDDSSLSHEESIPFTAEFLEAQSQSVAGGVAWTAMLLLKVVRFWEDQIVPTGNTTCDIEAAVMSDRLFAQERQFKSIPRERVHVIVTKIVTNISDIGSNEGRMLSSVVDFVREQRVAKLRLVGQEAMLLLERLPGDVCLDSVTSLGYSGLTLLRNPESERQVKLLESSLSRFPLVVSLTGESFYPVYSVGFSPADVMSKILPESLRRNVTSLVVPYPKFAHWTPDRGPTTRLQLLKAITVYPALQELGVLTLFSSRSSWEEFISSPLTTEVHRGLAQLRKLHLHIHATDVDCASSPQHSVNLAETLARTLPRLHATNVSQCSHGSLTERHYAEISKLQVLVGTRHEPKDVGGDPDLRHAPRLAG
ncbi:hypothetical protein HDU93_000758 [Gonapodya sp. JEL0774]|nr:hypothetical protein HDU93_000758 [Gonapodya sp. JEL0774]